MTHALVARVKNIKSVMGSKNENMKINEIVGIWESGNITMAFGSEGKLVYCIEDEKKDKQCIFMTYEIKGDTIVTDQPSRPNRTVVKYEVDVGKNLLKIFGVDGDVSVWKRKDM